MPDQIPRVVIVGGGFGGLAAAKALKNAPVEIALIDRNNHHTFQPLLYQVATGELSPSHIGSPIRSILGRQKNATVLLAEVTGVEKERRSIYADSSDRTHVSLAYDYLILATGAQHSYFGHDEFERFAPGLKTLADAVATRNKILAAFELAETERDPSKHKDLLTFVLVGGGPTGVELAAAISVLVRSMVKSEFRRIDPQSTRVVLVDHGQRLLSSFSEELSRKARQRLTDLGVEVQLGQSVEQIDGEGVIVNGQRIFSKTVIWAAGVKPSPAGKWLGVETDHAGRIRIQPDLTVPGQPEIFVVGDTASLDHAGKPLPGVAQVAIQQGRYAANLIRQRLAGRPAPRPFSYFDKGNMAVVGRGFAVLESGKVRLSGFTAFMAWAAVHLQFLGTDSLRLTVFVQWVWTYLTSQRGSRLIIHHHAAGQGLLGSPDTEQRGVSVSP